MALRYIWLLIVFAPGLLWAQSPDSVALVSKADSALIKSEAVLSQAEAAASMGTTAPGQIADTLSPLQKVYAAEAQVVDSINTVVSTPGQKVNESIRAAESHTTDKYNNVASEANEGLSGVGINKPLGEASLGEAGSPQGTTGVLPSTGELLDGVVPGGVNTEAIGQAKDIVTQGQQVLGQGQALGGEVKAIGQGDMTQTENLDALAESQLAKTGAMKELEAQAGAFEGLGSPAGGSPAGGSPAGAAADGLSVSDPRAMAEQQLKKEIATLAAAQLGKQVKPLEAGVSSVEKYKSKYKEVQSFRNKQWVKRTSLADQSLRERIVPGLTFQVLDGDYLIIDFVPQVSYLFNTKWQTGLGGVYRTNISKRDRPDKARYDVYGFSTFTTYQVWKTFWLYTEASRNNVDIHFPASAANPAMAMSRVDFDWLLGIRKSHQFTRHVKGHAQVLFNVLYAEKYAPYPSRLHLRFGFEWYLKPPKEKKEEISPDQP